MRWAVASVLLTACNASSAEPDTRAPPRTSEVDAGPVHVASEALRRCAAANGSLSSIADAVARFNALAPAADGPCFIATLPRPLAVVSTFNVSSAQPAKGKASPRLFFLLPKLVISAVPEGEGGKVIEFGEWVSPTRTIKAELGLPVTAPLAEDAPFVRVLRDDTQTMCATCHRNEERHPSIANAFVSAAYRPEPGMFVTVTELEALHDTCTREDDPSTRCAMLHAVFDFGAVTQGAFAQEVGTFIEH